MKRILFALLTLLIILTSCNAPPEKSYRLAEMRETVGGSTSVELYTYDAAGRLVKTEKNSGGKITRSETVEYVGDSDLPSYRKVSLGGNNLNEFYYTYDENGRLAENSTKLNGVLSHITTYVYDGQGRITSSSTVNALGEQSYTESYEYTDEYGSYICTTATLVSTTVVEQRYNERGDIIAVIAQGISSHIAYIYGADGEIIKETTSDESGNPYGSTTYTYDEHGNMIEAVSCLSDGTPYRTVKYIYEEYEK